MGKTNLLHTTKIVDKNKKTNQNRLSLLQSFEVPYLPTQVLGPDRVVRLVTALLLHREVLQSQTPLCRIHNDVHLSRLCLYFGSAIEPIAMKSTKSTFLSCKISRSCWWEPTAAVQWMPIHQHGPFWTIVSVNPLDSRCIWYVLVSPDFSHLIFGHSKDEAIWFPPQRQHFPQSKLKPHSICYSPQLSHLGFFLPQRFSTCPKTQQRPHHS